MSAAFVSGRRGDPSQRSVQSLLDENTQLIQAIVDYQNKGKAYECTQYQQILHRNLVYLATLADSGQNAPSMNLPAPGSQGAASSKPTVPGVASTAGGGVATQGIPTPPGSIQNDPMTSSMPQATVSQASNSDMAPNIPAQNSLGGPSGAYNSTAPVAASPMGQGSTSQPRLPHQPMSAPNPMSYHSSPSNQARPASGMGAPLSSQSQMQHHGAQLPQHMMPQGQQSQQQYMMQQRQMQFRPSSQQQQMVSQQPQQQQAHLPQNPSNYNMSSSGMVPPGYSQQQQPPNQRYNPYGPPQPQQQTRPHMGYSQSQPQGISPQSIQQPVGQGMGQPSLGQPTMGPSSMGQSPMSR